MAAPPNSGAPTDERGKWVGAKPTLSLSPLLRTSAVPLCPCLHLLLHAHSTLLLGTDAEELAAGAAG